MPVKAEIPPTEKQLDYCYILLERVGSCEADEDGQPLFEKSMEEADKFIKKHKNSMTYESDMEPGDMGSASSQ